MTIDPIYRVRRAVLTAMQNAGGQPGPEQYRRAAVAPPQIFTVGHSNRSLGSFLGLLDGNEIQTVVDVRSVPFSKHNPQFRREPLAIALSSHGLSYFYLGRSLGGRPDDRRLYDDRGNVRYDLVAASVPFRNAINRVLRLAESTTLAVMCSEKNPACCHRQLLIGREVERLGFPVVHLLDTTSHRRQPGPTF